MLPPSICDKCIRECQWRVPSGGLAPHVITCPRIIPKPQTHADGIRAMSDEELARFMVRKSQCPDGYTSVFGPHCVEENGCEWCWLEWLKKEREK